MNNAALLFRLQCLGQGLRQGERHRHRYAHSEHSIYSTDSLVLHTARGLAASERQNGNELALVTSDHRLITAAKAEGLQVINPETATLAEIETLLSLPESPA